MHAAVLEQDIQRVNALINFGAKASDTATIVTDGHVWIENATALSISIYKKNPEIVSLMLQAKDISNAVLIECWEEKEKTWTSFDLAVNIAKQTKERKAILVRTFAFITQY